MTLDQLQLIDTIVKTGSFSAAAKTLHRAQSAISYSVKNLEEEWGIEIFDRSSYRVKLSKSGQAILAKIRTVLQSAEALDKHSRSLSSALEPVVSISINNLFPTNLFLSFLVKFKKAFPNTQLRLTVDHLGAPAEKLEAGDTDLAISMPVPTMLGIDSKPVYTVELIGVGSKQYLGTKKLSNLDLLTKTQIIVSSQSPKDSGTGGGIIEGSDQWSVADLATKQEMILKSLGFGYMPSYLVESELRKGKLKEISCMKRIKVPMALQRRIIDPMGPAKTYIWENSLL